MGGRGAPDDLGQAHLTQTWLAVGDEPKALETGRFLYRQRPAELRPVAHDPELQGRLIDYCRELSGAGFALIPATNASSLSLPLPGLFEQSTHR